MMIALADENDDEKIDWREFIPIGIDAVKTIYVRNMSKREMDMKQPEPEALKFIFWDEIMKTYKLLEKRFQKLDNVKEGACYLQHFKDVVRGTKFLTPKEKNLLIRL